jgi:hypothetical protein
MVSSEAAALIEKLPESSSRLLAFELIVAPPGRIVKISCAAGGATLGRR